MPFPYQARKFIKHLSPANNPAYVSISDVAGSLFYLWSLPIFLQWDIVIPQLESEALNCEIHIANHKSLRPFCMKSRTCFTLHPPLGQANTIKNKIFIWLRMLLCCTWNLHRMAFPGSVWVHACWPGNAHVYSQIVKWIGILFSSVNKL